MFDPAVEVATAAQLADRIVATHAAVREAECEELVLAAAWADIHYLDTGADDYRPLVQRACAWGGDGCPQVAEHCAHEPGALRGTGAVAARMLIAGALDPSTSSGRSLRHRLPRLWALVTTGAVRAWQARAVAQATHELSWESCAVGPVLSLSKGRPDAQQLSAGAGVAEVPAADHRSGARGRPGGAPGAWEAARTERGVWSYAGEHGLRTIVAKAASGDVRWFMAAVDRIAEVLRLEGDLDPVDARRAKAVGILAQPALALELLTRHAGDPDRQGQTEPSYDEPVDESGQDGERGERSLVLEPSGADLRRARPRVVLHLHLSDSSLRAGDGWCGPEHGDPLTLDQVREWLADTGCHVTVRPVVDPVETAQVDAYEIPYRLRDALFLRNPVDVFPYGNATSRTLDLDHTIPFVPPARGGPPGHTGQHNLGPFTRSHHRALTFGKWQRQQPSPGTYVFRSPSGYVFLVTNQGTLNLGRTPFTRAFWELTNTSTVADVEATAA